MRICGIDLGTTNSCIYVVERDEHRLITDEHGHQTFPSAVHVSRSGKLTLGHAAINRLDELPGPVIAIKRKMGSTETVVLGNEPKTPVQVSAMILSFLKELAERQLGEPVERAVVTVPAYFSHIQRQQTDEAARLAGFREVTTLLEPVAAALAYSLSNTQETLRVFVYDLGGGTFDATLLEKDPHGAINVLSFGGDAFLGGEDIDTRLTQVLLERLRDKHYQLDLDLEQPEDFSLFQRLKFYAELAKQELSDKAEVTMVRQGLFEDQDGNTVDMDLTITRQELETCAEDLIQRSIAESLATLEKAHIALDSIDEIVMVGGMSRMPLAQQRLAAAFQRQPKVVDPDLIVARGAAIKAAELFGEQAVTASGLRMELRYERRTNQGRVNISGLFDRPLRGYTVYLITAEGEELAQILDGSDRYTFASVSLALEAENVFTLAVEDPQGNTVIERELHIVQQADARQILSSPGSVVTKPIAVRTVDGMEVLFPENTALPHTASYTFETADQSGQIVVPIWEGNHEVTRLVIKDIPTDLKVGTPVMVQVKVAASYDIQASATVLDIKREVAAQFRIEPVDTARLTSDSVRHQLVMLDQQAQEATAKCTSQQAVQLFRVRYQGLKDQIEAELSEMQPNRARLHEKLSELRALFDTLPAPEKVVQLQPPFMEFSEQLTAIQAGAIENNHPRLREVQPQIDALRERAKQAWDTKDVIAWRRVNEQLGAIANALQPEISPLEKALGMAAWLHNQQVSAIQGEIEEIFLFIQLGLLDPQEAINRLIHLYKEHVAPLQAGLAKTAEPPVASTTVLEGIIRKRRATSPGGN